MNLSLRKDRKPVWLLLTAILAVSVGIVGLVSYSHENQSGPSASPYTPILFVDQLGGVSSLSQARQSIGSNFNLPSGLPSELTLVNIRTSPNLVALVYFSRSMPGISFYDNATLLVLLQRDNSSYSTAATNSPSAFLSQSGANSSVNIPVFTQTVKVIPLTVSGHQGFGSNPTNFGSFSDTGRIEWWANGIHYTILGDLSVNTLLSIATSMNT